MNSETLSRWRSVRLLLPATIDTITMDLDMKKKVNSDFEAFLKSKQYYNRLGPVWKRGYLFYGPSDNGFFTQTDSIWNEIINNSYNLNIDIILVLIDAYIEGRRWERHRLELVKGLAEAVIGLEGDGRRCERFGGVETVVAVRQEK
ncbi:unnamed protein product [Lactuca virosa]|uniref:Uncharacterized protein n=1 Tax=Lactuca virosa TaxID=75947 RepID=A0AAU9PS50_9ASTR|nr:unnamed protein product [Lactuca virosa]